jgi:hypothetical protein
MSKKVTKWLEIIAYTVATIVIGFFSGVLVVADWRANGIPMLRAALDIIKSIFNAS